MFSVYKITNLINNKCYIGSSTRVEQRWVQHKNTAFNPNSKQYNYPLYCAFRKYGLNNFKFEILSSNYNTVEDMQNDELNYIIFYDSVNKGYNQTYNTLNFNIGAENLDKYRQSISQKCALVDNEENIIEIYNSYQEASRKNGNRNSASHIRQVCKGLISSYCGLYFRDLDNDNNVIHKEFKPYKNKKSIIGIPLDEEKEDVYVESILKASELYNINRRSLQKCIAGEKKYSNVGGYIWRRIENGEIIQNDIPIEQIIEEYNRTHPQINGERHTITEWAKIYNISTNSIYKRINKGMSLIEAIITPKGR